MGWQEEDVRVNGATLRAYRRGAGEPVLLVHGAADDARTWDGVAESLEGEHEVVAFDARCHGASESIGFGPGEAADDVVGVADALGLDRPVVIGHSMGALAVAQAVATRPGRFRAAVLGDPPTWAPRLQAPPGGGELGVGQAITDSARTLQELPRDRALAVARTRLPGATDEQLAQWVSSKQRFRPVDDWSGTSSARRPWQETVGCFDLPVLLVCGVVARGAMVPIAVADEARRLCPTLRVAQVDAGHALHTDDHDAFVGAVRAFLAAPTA